MSRKQVKVALAGIAGFGDFYLETLLRRQPPVDAELVGVVEPAPWRCNRLGELQARSVPFHATIQELFARTPVDLMMIASPIHLHAPLTCFALEHGANVLCEKPLAGTLADALKMLEAQKRSTGFAAIGYQWCYSQAVQQLKRDVIAGELGRPTRFRSLAFFPRSVGYFMRNNWAGRIHTDNGEGVLDSPVNNATAHYLHNMLYVLGATRETSAMPLSVEAELYRANGIENYDTAALRVKTDAGAEVLFYTTLTGPEKRGPKLRFEFERAVVEFDAMETSPQLVARYHDGRIKRYGNPNQDKGEKVVQCIDAVKSGAALPCGIEASLPHTLCVVAAQEAASGIREFPAGMRRVTALDGGDMMVGVPGLQEALLECYERAALPGDGGYPWATSGKAVELGDGTWHERRGQLAAAGANMDGVGAR